MKELLKFWAPLAATTLLMSAEGPYLNALVARSPEAIYDLAAFGIAFSLALLIESPVIMILTATSALLRDRASFYLLRRFITTLNILCTVMMLLLLVPPVFDLLSNSLLNLEENVKSKLWWALLSMVLWPAAIGYRRFYQGVMVKEGSTHKLTIGAAGRVLGMAVCGYVLYRSPQVSGAAIGSISLTVGVIVEAVIARYLSLPEVARTLSLPEAAEALTYRKLLEFYIPVTFAIYLTFGVQPVITFAIGRSVSPTESLAVFAINGGLVFLFQSLVLPLQETALVKETAEKKVARFALLLGVFFSVLLGLATSPYLSGPIIHAIFGLTGPLLSLSSASIPLLMFCPLITSLASYSRGVLLARNQSSAVMKGTIIEMSTLICMLWVTVELLSLRGIFAAHTSVVCASLVSCLYLLTCVKIVGTSSNLKAEVRAE